jgi:Arc/MetJ-type ribon-helix-helix transcriptional regulator
MPTSVRLDQKTESLVRRLARERAQTKSEVIREALVALARSEDRTRRGKTLYDSIAHVVGSVKGLPPDLSERTGEKFRALLRARKRQ